MRKMQWQTQLFGEKENVDLPEPLWRISAVIPDAEEKNKLAFCSST